MQPNSNYFKSTNLGYYKNNNSNKPLMLILHNHTQLNYLKLDNNNLSDDDLIRLFTLGL